MSDLSMPRTLDGVVVSNKMKDTITVRVERRIKHPKYGKYIRRSSKIHAQDTGNTAQMGDVVKVKECRPISKTKSWALIDIKERATEV